MAALAVVAPTQPVTSTSQLADPYAKQSNDSDNELTNPRYWKEVKDLKTLPPGKPSGRCEVYPHESEGENPKRGGKGPISDNKERHENLTKYYMMMTKLLVLKPLVTLSQHISPSMLG